MAAALPAAEGDEADVDIEIDENLFDGDDLDLVDDELDELDLNDWRDVGYPLMNIQWLWFGINIYYIYYVYTQTFFPEMTPSPM